MEFAEYGRLGGKGRRPGGWLASLSLVLVLAVFSLSPGQATGQAKCPPFPNVELWGDIDHENVSLYVERRMDGDWIAYVKRLETVRDQLQSIYDRRQSATIQLGDRRLTLKGDDLDEYLDQSDRRIEVVICLARQFGETVVPARSAGAKAPATGATHNKATKTASSPNQGNPESGSALAAACASCHGERGVIDDPLFPNIGGQNVSYLIKQIRAMRDAARDRAGAQFFGDAERKKARDTFKSFLRSERSAEFMDEAVLTLTNRQIYDLATFYGTQTCGQSEAVNSFAVPPLRSDRCPTCHGKAGITDQSRFPNLAGQHRDYLRDQLIAFKIAGLEIKSGKKEITRNRSMALEAADLTTTDIEQLAAYYASLPCQ